MGLWLFGSSINAYSQIGSIMLIGLAAKNGILIVECADQLRDRGVELTEAIVSSAAIHLRPVLSQLVEKLKRETLKPASAPAASETH